MIRSSCKCSLYYYFPITRYYYLWDYILFHMALNAFDWPFVRRISLIGKLQSSHSTQLNVIVMTIICLKSLAHSGLFPIVLTHEIPFSERGISSWMETRELMRRLDFKCVLCPNSKVLSLKMAHDSSNRKMRAAALKSSWNAIAPTQCNDDDVCTPAAAADGVPSLRVLLQCSVHLVQLRMLPKRNFLGPKNRNS